MGIHVIRAVLRVIFEDEDGRFVPITAARDRFDDPPERRIILRDHRARRTRARPRGCRMVVPQPDDVQLRQLTALLELTEFPQPRIDPRVVEDVEVVRRIVGAEVPLQPGNACFDHAGLLVLVHELAVAPDGDIGADGNVPDVSERRGRQIAVRVALTAAALAEIDAAPLSIVGGPDLLDGIGRVGPGGERMAVIADLGVHVEIVQQDEFLSERVRVRSDRLSEQCERRIPVAGGDVTKDLIVRCGSRG